VDEGLVGQSLKNSIAIEQAAELAQNDFAQAITLATLVMDEAIVEVEEAFDSAPAGMVEHIRPLLPRLRTAFRDQPQALDLFEQCLGGDERSAVVMR
jgi:hypothetical protein